MLDFASNPSLKNKSYGWGSKKQNLKVKTNLRGGKIAQQVNVTVTKSGDPSLTWGVYMVEERTLLASSPLTFAHTPQHVCPHTKHIQKKKYGSLFKKKKSPQIDIFFS